MRYWLIYLLFMPIHVDALFGNKEAKLKANLAHTQQQIQALEKTIYHSQHEEKQLQEQLKGLEKDLGHQSERVRNTQQYLQANQQELDHLLIKKQQLHLETIGQQHTLEQLVTNAFTQYRRQKLRLLFSAQDFATIARLNYYYQAFSHAQAQLIKQLGQQLEKNEQLTQRLQATQLTNQQLLNELSAQEIKLKHQKASRTQVLSKLTHQLGDSSQTLSQLQKQSQHISAGLELLTKKLTKLKPTVVKSTQFKNLVAPLNIPLIFTQRGQQTYLEAPTGTSVQAISAGQVVFAEWLRGLGLLLIIDHGKGYLSLYGSNQVLYKQLGDKVQPGELVARVGQSGGHTKPGLYFEIRKDGRVLNPKTWFN